MSVRIAVAIAGALAIGACGIERRPPTLMIRRGDAGAVVHRAVLMPTECTAQRCQGLDAITAAELAFRGIDIVDLDRIAAVERTRTEVDLSRSSARSGRLATSTSERRVTVSGPLLSDLDLWTMREQLAAMGVDGVVRVRAAMIEAKPARVVALVRVTRASDASLVWASACEVELSAVATEAAGADEALRCALRGAYP